MDYLSVLIDNGSPPSTKAMMIFAGLAFGLCLASWAYMRVMRRAN